MPLNGSTYDEPYELSLLLVMMTGQGGSQLPFVKARLQATELALVYQQAVRAPNSPWEAEGMPGHWQ